MKENYVTIEMFNNESHRVHEKFDKISHTILNLDTRLKKVEQEMATKTDLTHLSDKLMGHMDYLFKKYREFDQEELVQSHQLQEMRRQVKDHEKRITSLESSKN